MMTKLNKQEINTEWLKEHNLPLMIQINQLIQVELKRYIELFKERMIIKLQQEINNFRIHLTYKIESLMDKL